MQRSLYFVETVTWNLQNQNQNVLLQVRFQIKGITVIMVGLGFKIKNISSDSVMVWGFDSRYQYQQQQVLVDISLLPEGSVSRQQQLVGIVDPVSTLICVFACCLQYNKEARDTQDLLKRMETEINQKYSPDFKDMYQMDGLIRELDVSVPFESCPEALPHIGTASYFRIHTCSYVVEPSSLAPFHTGHTNAGIDRRRDSPTDNTTRMDCGCHGLKRDPLYRILSI